MSQGRFVWHDLYVADPEKAIAFYTGLLGWTTQEHDMGDFTYTMVIAGTEGVGGISGLQDPQQPPHWISYTTVPDVFAAAETVKNTGGSIYQDPFPIEGVGTMGYATDSEGARFSIFQESTPDAVPALPTGTPAGGTAAWHELVTSDVAKAVKFYSNLFGWNEVVWDMDGFKYHGLCLGETPMAGVFEKSDPSVPSAWSIYYEVPGTIDEAIAKVTELGGTLIGEKINVPGTGDFHVLKDPGGAVFGLLKSEAM